MAVACMNQTCLLPLRGCQYSWRDGYGYRKWRKKKNVTSFALVCLEVVIFQLDLKEYNSLHRKKEEQIKVSQPPVLYRSL